MFKVKTKYLFITLTTCLLKLNEILTSSMSFINTFSQSFGKKLLVSLKHFKHIG